MAFDTTNPPLPANAAQESSGNLDIQSATLRALTDLSLQQLAVLNAIQLQLANITGIHVDPTISTNDQVIQ